MFIWLREWEWSKEKSVYLLHGVSFEVSVPLMIYDCAGTPCCAIFRGKRVLLGSLCGGGMDPAPLFVLWVLLLVLCVHCTFVLPLSNAERAQSAEGREAQIPRDQKGKNSITRMGN